MCRGWFARCVRLGRGGRLSVAWSLSVINSLDEAARVEFVCSGGIDAGCGRGPGSLVRSGAVR